MTDQTRYVGGIAYEPAVIGYDHHDGERTEIVVLRSACGCQLPTEDFALQVVCAEHQRPTRPFASYPVGS